MRILLITSSYLPVLGGLQTVAHRLAVYLRAHDHEVLVITNHYPRSLQNNERIDDIPIRRLLFLKPALAYGKRPDLLLASLYYHPLTHFQLRRLLADFKPDIVNFHFPMHLNRFVLALYERFAFRLIISLHGYDIEGFDYQPLGEQQIFRRLMLLTDGVTACSQYLLDAAIAIEPAIRAKGIIIPNGIDLVRFHNRNGHSHFRPFILAFGRLAPVKGFDLLIDAFARLANAFPLIDLIIAGEGEMRTLLDERISWHELSNRIYLIGRASPEHIVRLINACRFVVISSRSESFGIAAIEAMAGGKPVLATDVGGLAELLPIPPNCLIPPTVDGLYKGMLSWLRNPDQLQNAQEINRERAKAFDWDTVLEGYDRLFSQR